MRNTIILVTGINGAGKTTFAKMLSSFIGKESTLLSKDTVNESVSDIIGKKNNDNFSLFITHLFKEMVAFCIDRKDKIIIIESPLKIEWVNILNELNKDNRYEYITVNIMCKSFNKLYERISNRIKNGERHPVHYCNEYNSNDINICDGCFESDMGSIDNFKLAMDNQIYNQINVGTVIDFDIDNDTIANVLNKVKEVLSK